MHGGRFSGDLSKSCTHLIAANAKGRKYQGAVNWGIKVVNVDWVVECIKSKGRIDESLFPVKGANEAISHNIYESEEVSKVTASTVESESTSSSNQDSPHHQPSMMMPPPVVKIDDDDSTDMFLKGFQFYLDGFPPDKEKSLITMINSSGKRE